MQLADSRVKLLYLSFLIYTGEISWTDLMALDRLLYLFAHRFLCFRPISFFFCYSYVRQTKLSSSMVNFWAHYKTLID